MGAKRPFLYTSLKTINIYIMAQTYGIAKTNNELVIFLGNNHIQFKFVNKKLKIRKYITGSHEIYVTNLYYPNWELVFKSYKY